MDTLSLDSNTILAITISAVTALFGAIVQFTRLRTTVQSFLKQDVDMHAKIDAHFEKNSVDHRLFFDHLGKMKSQIARLEERTR